jgi:DNA gyrase/topoisomerase IV subunit A
LISDERVFIRAVEEEMKTSYLDYSMEEPCQMLEMG